MKQLRIENHLKEIREEKRLTQKELAELCGISQGTLSDLENGKHTPSIDVAYKISLILQMHVYDVFTPIFL